MGIRTIYNKPGLEACSGRRGGRLLVGGGGGGSFTLRCIHILVLTRDTHMCTDRRGNDLACVNFSARIAAGERVRSGLCGLSGVCGRGGMASGM